MDFRCSKEFHLGYVVTATDELPLIAGMKLTGVDSQDWDNLREFNRGDFDSIDEERACSESYNRILLRLLENFLDDYDSWKECDERELERLKSHLIDIESITDYEEEEE